MNQYSAQPYAIPHNNMPSVSPYYNRAAPSRVSSTTTEFRGSTNPDEDWTKISDLAERRRIQNRIAQRNYRKKLKRRLEDLERRAASRSLSPNGEDTDGRSTRESSAEGITSPPPSSDPHMTDPRDTHYNLPPYTPSYRATYSPPQHYYPPTTGATGEPTTTAEYSTPHYLYSYSAAPTLSSIVDATCGSSVSSCGSDSGHSYLPLPSARLSGSSQYSVSTPPDYSPKTSPVVYNEDHMSPFSASYASLTEPPTDPSFLSQYYHDDHGSPHSAHSPIHIKSEPYSS